MGVLGFRVAFALLMVAFAAHLSHYLVHAHINQDEGFYLYAANRVMAGELPYRDFAFVQGPLLPFVYGPAQELFGPGLTAGRLTSLTLGLTTAVLGSRLVFLHAGAGATLLFLALLSITPAQLFAFTSTRTEALSATLLMLTAFFLTGRGHSVRASALALAAAMGAAATRLSSLPVALIVFAIVVYRHRESGRDLAWALAPALAIAGLSLAIVVAASPEVVWFQVFTTQAERHLRFRDVAPWSLLDYAQTWLHTIRRLPSAYGIVPLLGAISGATLIVLHRSRPRPSWVRSPLALLGLAFAAYLPQLLPRDSFPIYFAAAYPLVLACVCMTAGALLRSAPNATRAIALAAVIAALVFQRTSTVEAEKHLYLRNDPPDLAELQHVADYLKTIVPPDGTLGTLDTYLAVESGLLVPPSWGLSLFSYFPRLDAQEARRYHVLSRQDMARSFANQHFDAVVLSDRALGVLTSRGLGGLRPQHKLSEADLYRALPSLTSYRLERTFLNFGQFQDPLYVLLPKRAPTPPSRESGS